MLKSLVKVLRNFIRERAFEVEGEILARDPEFGEVDAKIKEVLERIRSKLPEEEQGLVMELDEDYHQAAVVMNLVMYRSGLMDGMRLRRVLRGVGSK
ncbi:MAG TPA: hypothetical protein VHY08_25890 [Bacillota bacterium]|nr:hypothetical protein [Bacillota bacterium]